MPKQSHTITLRRERMAEAANVLAPHELAVLVQLAVRADAGSGRVNATAEQLAEALALPIALLERAVERLASDDLVDPWIDHDGNLFDVELGDVLVRDARAPDNLPFAPNS